MTPNDTLKAVREAVVRAVPEILELKFGCVIEDQRYPDNGRLYTIVAECGICFKHKRCDGERETCDVVDGKYAISSGEDYDDFGYRAADIKTEDIDKGKDWKVIGRPIRLADVLRAIAEAQVSNGEPYLVDAAGQFYDIRQQKAVGYLTSNDVLAQWPLPDDNLDHASPECVAFLYSILGTTV